MCGKLSVHVRGVIGGIRIIQGHRRLGHISRWTSHFFAPEEVPQPAREPACGGWPIRSVTGAMRCEAAR